MAEGESDRVLWAHIDATKAFQCIVSKLKSLLYDDYDYLGNVCEEDESRDHVQE